MELQEALEIMNKYPQVLNHVMCELYKENHTRPLKCIKVTYDPFEQSLDKYYDLGNNKLDHYSAYATPEDVIKYAEIINIFLLGVTPQSTAHLGKLVQDYLGIDSDQAMALYVKAIDMNPKASLSRLFNIIMRLHKQWTFS